MFVAIIKVTELMYNHITVLLLTVLEAIIGARQETQIPILEKREQKHLAVVALRYKSIVNLSKSSSLVYQDNALFGPGSKLTWIGPFSLSPSHFLKK